MDIFQLELGYFLNIVGIFLGKKTPSGRGYRVGHLNLGNRVRPFEVLLIPPEALLHSSTLAWGWYELSGLGWDNFVNSRKMRALT